MSKHHKKNIDKPVWVENYNSDLITSYSLYRTNGSLVATGFVQGQPGRHRAQESE